MRLSRAVACDGEPGRNRGALNMHVGLTMFPTDYSIPPQDLAVEAEARGYESLWLPEHSHIPTSRKSRWAGGPELPKYYYESYDPFLSLAAAAAVTKTIKLATGICLVVERDPIHTAKEVSTIDRLSSGRFIFGVGGGWNEEEMANHGTAFATRFKLMRERIQAMKQIWTQSAAAGFRSAGARWTRWRCCRNSVKWQRTLVATPRRSPSTSSGRREI